MLQIAYGSIAELTNDRRGIVRQQNVDPPPRGARQRPPVDGGAGEPALHAAEEKGARHEGALFAVRRHFRCRPGVQVCGQIDNLHFDLHWSQPKQDAFLLLCYLT